MNTRFPGIDAKIALRFGELFLYQSLCFDLVRVTGLEPDNTLFYMFFLVLICAKMQKTSRLFLIVIRLNMAYIFL